MRKDDAPRIVDKRAFRSVPEVPNLSIVSRPNVLRLASAAMLGGALEGIPFARSASAQTITAVTVGIVSSSSDAPFFIADKMGFFRAAGIDAQFTNFDGAPQMIAPLGTGQ